MIDSFFLERFGPINRLKCKRLTNINVIVGKNGTGKSYLLKALYSAIKTVESHKRGNEPRSASELLFDKLYWTFQPEKMGDLVSKGERSALAFEMMIGKEVFSYSFGKETAKSITGVRYPEKLRTNNSIFLPAKEVLSLHQIILSTRDRDLAFGFDDTYFDLARALKAPTTKGKNYRAFADSRSQLEEMLQGRIEYDESSGRWYFKKGNQKYLVGLTSEGTKKISILDTLLGNRYLDEGSVVFFDEPESALHPAAISRLLEIVFLLASSSGMQFFLATHSYFVIKKLYLLAQRNKTSISFISNDDDNWHQSDLLDGMPKNPIIDESIHLYEEEMDLSLS